MKKQLLTLALTGMVALNTMASAQSTDSALMAQSVTPAIKETKCTIKVLQSSTLIPATTSTASTASTASKARKEKTARRTKNNANATGQSKAPTTTGMEQDLATFVFVVNRGEVFSVNARGELSEVSLSGFSTDALPVGNEAALNESACLNTITIAGAATLNEYMAQPSTAVTASLRLRPLTAPRGLTLGLTIDGTPQRVLLPFDSGDCHWQAGYTYRYVITLNGGTLQVTGMTVMPTTRK